MININEASYSYKRSLENQLKKISIKINQGEVILLCGKSGSGKTTITKLINGLIPHFLEGNLLGNIFINGINTKQMKIYEISEKVGTIFQNPKTQFFNLDSDSELTFGLENLGENPDKIKRQVFKVVRDLGIERLKNRNVFMMSGGEKQLLAIASIYAPITPPINAVMIIPISVGIEIKVCNLFTYSGLIPILIIDFI